MPFKKHVILHFKLPTVDNGGNPIPPNDFVKVKNEFIDTFGGLSINPTTDRFWKEIGSGRIFYDETLEYVILSEKQMFSKEIEGKLDGYIERFKVRFKQLSIFCYFHEVMATPIS